MSANTPLGLLVTSQTKEQSDIGNYDFDAIIAAANPSTIDDKKVADQAVKDAKETPSLWFVNFPSKDAATTGSKELAAFMQDVLDYRCWASGVWWKTVYSSTKVPQDGSKESTARRSAFVAKVGMKHMRSTGWLAMSTDTEINKHIACETNQFHTDLIKAVLEGFVDVTPSVFKALEAILDSLSKTVEVSTGNDETRTIICEKYQYIPEADVIKSYVRIISFHVSDKMKEVHKAKTDSKTVTCDINYVEYEAEFNRTKWQDAAKDLKESEKKATADFVKQSTIDCDP